MINKESESLLPKREQERMEQIKNGIWRPKIFSQFSEVICGASTKEYPGFVYLRNPDRLEEPYYLNREKYRAAKNLTLFLQRLDSSLDPRYLVYPELAHTANVRLITPLEIRAHVRPARGRAKIKMEKTDGLITQEAGLALMILGADCPSVGVYDPEHHAIGVFHSGWKGTCLNITRRGLDMMRKTFDTRTDTVYAVIGPGISSDYEVGEDVYQAFLISRNFSQEELEKIFRPKPEGKYTLDLHQAILYELEKARVPRGHIEITSLRTDLDNDLFPSYRSEKGEADRFAFVMALKRS